MIAADAALEIVVVDLPSHRHERLRPLLRAAADPPSVVGVIRALRLGVDEIGEVPDVALGAGTHRNVLGSYSAPSSGLARAE
jgi:hypothetical protein